MWVIVYRNMELKAIHKDLEVIYKMLDWDVEEGGFDTLEEAEGRIEDMYTNYYSDIDYQESIGDMM